MLSSLKQSLCIAFFAISTAAVTVVPTAALAQNWPQFGYDAAHTFNNPTETVLTTANIANLRLSYSRQLSQFYISAPIQTGGKVVASTNIFGVSAINPVNGNIQFSTTAYPGIDPRNPASASGRVFITSYQDNSNPTADIAYVTALGSTGNILWSAQNTPDVGVTEHRFSTPTVAGGKVLVSDENNAVYAFDAVTGSLAWKSSIGSFKSLITVSGTHVVFSTLVGFPTDTLYSLNLDTGATEWSVTIPTGVSIQVDPILTDGKAVVVVASNTSTNLVGFNLTNGALAFTSPTFQFGYTSLAASAGRIYVSTGLKPGPSGPGNPSLSAYSSANGTLVWSTPLGGYGVESQFAVANNVVYFIGLNGGFSPYLRAANASTGALLDTSTLPTVDGQGSAITVTGGRVILTTSRGVLESYEIP